MFTYLLASETDHTTGVYVCALDLASGALRHISATSEIAPTQYMNFAPQQHVAYVTGVNGGDVEMSSGVVGAYAVEPETGTLTYLNQQPTLGIAPCYVVATADGRHVLVVNYAAEGGGRLCVYPVLDDGRLAEMSDTVQHPGKSVNPDRQTESHLHMVTTDPQTGLIFVTDLGTDKIMLYHVDAAGKLQPHDPPFVSVTPGSGPRHLALTDRHVYLVNELSNTLTVFDYDRAQGRLTERQTVSTLPDTFSGENYAADIHLLPSGKFLYISNRGHNSIGIFAVDSASGEVSPAGFEPVQGDWPRSFTIDPSGQILLVANQRSGNVTTFRIDPTSGLLTYTGHTFAVPGAICVKTRS